MYIIVTIMALIGLSPYLIITTNNAIAILKAHPIATISKSITLDDLFRLIWLYFC